MSSDETTGQAVELLDAVRRDLVATKLPLGLPGADDARTDIRNALANSRTTFCPATAAWTRRC